MKQKVLAFSFLIFGHNGERWNSLTVTTEFPVFHEVSRHQLCNNYTVVRLEILSTRPAWPDPSSHNHVCSFLLGDWEIYKPNHDLRELNILLGKPPRPQSGSLGCQLHCDCMCSFCVCKRDQDTQRERCCLWLSNMWLCSMSVHLQLLLKFAYVVHTCLYLWYLY